MNVKKEINYIGIMERKVTGAKESRMIRALEPVMSQHRLCFNTKAIKQKETQIQITRLTERRGALAHDDRVDVLSLAVNEWKDNLIHDVDSLIEKNKEKESQKKDDLFPERVSGAYRYVDKSQSKYKPILRSGRRR